MTIIDKTLEELYELTIDDLLDNLNKANTKDGGWNTSNPKYRRNLMTVPHILLLKVLKNQDEILKLLKK